MKMSFTVVRTFTDDKKPRRRVGFVCVRLNKITLHKQSSFPQPVNLKLFKSWTPPPMLGLLPLPQGPRGVPRPCFENHCSKRREISYWKKYNSKRVDRSTSFQLFDNGDLTFSVQWRAVNTHKLANGQKSQKKKNPAFPVICWPIRSPHPETSHCGWETEQLVG